MSELVKKAEIVDVRVHQGSSIRPTKSRRSSRGRKAKKGRNVVKIRVSLMPTEVQKTLLENDLALFNYFYKDTMNRLSSTKHIRDKNGMWLSYNPNKKRVKWTVNKKEKDAVKQTPKFVMMAQTAIWKEHQWMKECTYQVLHRATSNAFSEFLEPVDRRRFQIDGDKYEAKIKYGLKNGYLVMKKFGEFIQIEETGIPKGSLETALIYKENGEWRADLEVLEPPDKVMDIKEKNSMIETNTSSYEMQPIGGVFPIIEKIRKLEERSEKFKDIANRVIELNISDRKEAQKQLESEGNLDLFNMACVAGAARVKRFHGKFVEPVPEEYCQDIYNPPVFEVPKIRKNYFAMSEGFFIQGNLLAIPSLQAEFRLSGSRLSRCNLEYIVVYEDKNGKWMVSGKKHRRGIWRSFKEKFRESRVRKFILMQERLPF